MLGEALDTMRRCRPILGEIQASAEPSEPSPADATAQTPYGNNLRGLAEDLLETASKTEGVVNQTARALGVPMPEVPGRA